MLAINCTCHTSDSIIRTERRQASLVTVPRRPRTALGYRPSHSGQLIKPMIKCKWVPIEASFLSHFLYGCRLLCALRQPPVSSRGTACCPHIASKIIQKPIKNIRKQVLFQIRLDKLITLARQEPIEVKRGYFHARTC